MPVPIAADRRVKVGERDGFGDTVDHVFVSTDHFIIYTASKRAKDAGRLRYVLPDDYDAAKAYRKKLAPIAAELAFVSDVIAGMRATEFGFFRRPSILRVRTLDLLARAMQMAFEGETATAHTLVARAREEATTCRDSRNRMRYIFANLIAVALLVSAWFVDWSALGLPGLQTWLTDLRPVAPGVEAVFAMRDVLVLGALGAFFAVSGSINAVRVNHSIALSEMMYAGFVRVPIGVIAAGVVVLLISGGWILGSIDARFALASLYLFSFVAGFSELLVPNALKQAEARSKPEPSEPTQPETT